MGFLVQWEEMTVSARRSVGRLWLSLATYGWSRGAWSTLSL